MAEHPTPWISPIYTWLKWNGKEKDPGDYEVDEGTVIEFQVKIINGDVPGYIYVWLYDFKNGRAVWDSGVVWIWDAEEKYFNGAFEAKEDMELKFQAFYWDEETGKWVLYSEYG